MTTKLPLPDWPAHSIDEPVSMPARHLLLLMNAAGVLAGVVADVASQTPSTPADGTLVEAGLIATDEAGRTVGVSQALAEAMAAAADLLAPVIEAEVEILEQSCVSAGDSPGGEPAVGAA